MKPEQVKPEQLGLPPGLPELRGTEAQIRWAESIRDATMPLTAMKALWPNGNTEISQINDATWWIANRTTLPAGKYKKPSPSQIFAAQPAVVESDEDQALPGPKPGQKPPALNAASTINMETRVSDAEGFARSVSQIPKLAEAAILATFSRLYKDPMKGKLRLAAAKAMSEASQAIAKDVDAINRLLGCLVVCLFMTGCSPPVTTVTVYTRDDKPVVMSQSYDRLNIVVRSNRVSVEFISESSLRGVIDRTNVVLVEDETAKIELKK